MFGPTIASPVRSAPKYDVEMSSARQLPLGAFMRPASIHTGAWPDMNFNFAHMKNCIQTLERAKFDAFFMADLTRRWRTTFAKDRGTSSIGRRDLRLPSLE
jgi:hypothetical protein